MKQGTTAVETLDSAEAARIATTRAKPNKTQPPKPSPSSLDQAVAELTSDVSPDSERTAHHRPLKLSDAELVARAFAGDDVEAQFAHEKAQVAEADDDKVVDNTLPGWGSWVGEGISRRSVRKDQKRFQTVVKGVKQNERKDAKLERVIISERRVKKVRLYLQSPSLPVLN